MGTGVLAVLCGSMSQLLQNMPISFIDFCLTELSCKLESPLGLAFLATMNSCGVIIPCEKACIIIERPTQLLLDEQNRLHGEGTPAIAYPDGHSLYYFHNVLLPPKYSVHPHQWQASWLLTEENAELRRVLIEGIGYTRICQELGAVELDSWREYTLLRIDQNIDVEPIYLLKMTCHSYRVYSRYSCSTNNDIRA